MRAAQSRGATVTNARSAAKQRDEDLALLGTLVDEYDHVLPSNQALAFRDMLDRIRGAATLTLTAKQRRWAVGELAAAKVRANHTKPPPAKTHGFEMMPRPLKPPTAARRA